MRNYQNRKAADGPLERSVYHRVLALCEDVLRMEREREQLLDGIQIRGRRVSTKKERLRIIDSDLAAFHGALETIPEEYREGIRRNLCERVRCLDLPYAAESTWKRYRGRVISAIAANMRWI